MATNYVCDFCGEPIQEERDVARLSALGWGSLGEYHGGSCFAILKEAVENVCGRRREVPLTPRQILAHQHEDWRACRAGWAERTHASRESLVLHTLGSLTLTVPAIVQKLNEQHDMSTVYYSHVYPTVKAMFDAGELQRERVLRGGREVFAYTHRTDLAGPIVDLEQTFNTGTDGTVTA